VKWSGVGAKRRWLVYSIIQVDHIRQEMGLIIIH